ncbi:hypothetical protein [Nocardia abscessus]|uniref:hypothetical protein n=1 Tax=Nocardia abscessus TaxID=120957 RepID=UPI002456E076|nr:hypothetical protein [Nocardia abscessus]
MSTDSNRIGIGRPGAESLLRGASEIAKLIERAATTARPVDVAIAAQNQAMLGAVATAHALLAVEARLGQLVEQQRLANVMASQAPRDESGNPAVPLLDWRLDDDAVEYMRAAVSRIVHPGGAE